jgi:hypothetical protein
MAAWRNAPAVGPHRAARNERRRVCGPPEGRGPVGRRDGSRVPGGGRVRRARMSSCRSGTGVRACGSEVTDVCETRTGSGPIRPRDIRGVGLWLPRTGSEPQNSGPACVPRTDGTTWQRKHREAVKAFAGAADSYGFRVVTCRARCRARQRSAPAAGGAERRRFRPGSSPESWASWRHAGPYRPGKRRRLPPASSGRMRSRW